MASFYEEYLHTISNIPTFLNKYLTVPSLTRLKHIGYFCGMDYASKDVYNFKENISRFDHSLTVALLTWRFTKNKKETIAALFHDIATPCFSHVIDYMNKDYNTQESTEEYTEEIIKQDKTLLSYLNEDNINIKEISNFKNYTIIDNKRPKLCTDRLDGIILTGYAWAKNLNTQDMHLIINDLEIFTNEDNEKELGFKTLEVANKVIKINKGIDELVHSKEDFYMMELLSKITKQAIDNKIITYSDLFCTKEKELLDNIKSSNQKELKELLRKFETIKREDIPDITLANVKVRNINPLVNGKRLIERI